MTNRDSNDPSASRPRSEPEIIPPEKPGPYDHGGIWVSVDDKDGPRRMYIARPGPFTIILGLAVLSLVALVMLIVLLSVAVIWIPFVLALVAVFVVSIYWRRFRMWWASR